MFTTPTAVPTAAVVVRPSYPNTLVSSTTTTNAPWLLSTGQPSVVSILNTNSPPVYLATQSSNTTTNLIRQSQQTVHFISPSLTLINNSNHSTITNSCQGTLTNHVQSGICIETTTIGRAAVVNHDQQNSSLDESNCQDPEIELIVNNVVCSFALGCKLNLRRIAMEGANVIYRREHAMVLMKIRNPSCSANVWSSGKVTVTGTTSEDDAQRGARRIARCLQRLGFKTKLRNYRVVNCLATCTMPWPIDIVKLSQSYPQCVSYEPEIHPGATVRLNNKAVLKVFTTGSVTLTAPSVDVVNSAINEFYPQLFECRKMSHNEQQP